VSDPSAGNVYQGGTPLSDADLQRLDLLPLNGTIAICKGQQVPDGWVIIAEDSSIDCPGDFPNTWIIKKPAGTDVVCQVSPIPAGYVKIGEGNSVNCPGIFPNTWTIRKV